MERIGETLLVAALAFGLLVVTHSAARAGESGRALPRTASEVAALSTGRDRLLAGDASTESGISGVVDAAPPIRSTNLISIPYGFDTPLPVLDGGRTVVASGHGACTLGEQVTVAITVTQSTSGAVATGQREQMCTGELQAWSIRATADTSAPFTSDAAEACGMAVTREGGYVTDTFDWCRDVDLVRLDRRVYLPFINRW